MKNGVLEILALGDRFSASYRSIEETLRDIGDLSFREEHSFDNAEDMIDYVRNSSFDLVVMPNPYGNERRRWIYVHLKRLDFPVLVFDRGALPGSWFFDLGFNADSLSYHPLAWDNALREDENYAVEDYIQNAKNQLPLEHQGHRLGGEQLKQKLGLSGKKVLFIPFQRPSDTTIKFFCGGIKTFDNFICLVNQSRKLLEQHASEWVVVAKRHPLEQVRPHANVLFVDDDTHVHDLIEMSEAVLLINSGVGVIASLFDKPVLHAGDAFYSHPGMNRNVKTPEDVVYWLLRGFEVSKSARNRFIHHLVNKVYSFGTFETERVLHKDGAYRNITRKINFDTVKIPEGLVKKKLLFVTPVIPVPINRGSAHRTDQVIRALLDAGIQIKLLVLNQSEEKTTSVALKKRLEAHYANANLTVEVRRHPNYGKAISSLGSVSKKLSFLRRKFDRLTYRDALINNVTALPGNFEKLICSNLASCRYDFAWFNYMKVLPRALPKTRSKIIVDMHDMQSTRIKSDVLPTLEAKRRAKYLDVFMRSEKSGLDACDVAISISSVETDAIRATYSPKSQVVTLNASDDAKLFYTGNFEHDIAFVGSNSAPNVDGLLWFINEVFPLIVQAHPTVSFLIQGNVNRNKLIKSAVHDSMFKSNIKQQGFVEIIDDVYKASRLIVCPIRYGTGMKIKVVEALAYGKALVGTPAALEGIDTSYGLACEMSAAKFANASTVLIKQNTARLEAEECSRKTFEAGHSYSALKNEIINKILLPA
jgi:glycosyltransferase involved in cell wall biosynthesis